MKITPIGAAGEVTGSSFLIESAKGGRFLIDCGLFQGRGAEDEGKNRHFPFDPDDIDAVLLTHAHLDHCGRLPYLHALGFRGKVYATPSTCDLAQFILLDSAKIQTEDAERHQRKGQRSGRPTQPALYDEQDVLHLLRYVEPQPYEHTFSIGSDLQVTFHQSGHILGSAFIEVHDGYSSVVFSGDLGTPNHNVVPDPTPAPKCDLIFCESTYGDRLHKSEDDSVAELKDAINAAYQAGGNVVIPSFAMERTQDLLFKLRELRDKGEVPQNPVYVDSPLAINITRVYEHHLDDLDDETRAVVNAHKDPFAFPGMTTCTTPQQSRDINGKTGVIIIAGSGMCNGGRIVHHLKYNLWRENTAIVFIGYQAEGTLGRRIIEHAPNITIEHEPVTVRAKIYTINGFSAHADQAALQNWLATSGPARIVLNHGETDASTVLADLLKKSGRDVDIAAPDRSYDTEALPAVVR